MRQPPRSRGHRTANALVAVGVGVAVALVLGIGIPTLARPVTSCAIGREVGSASIWTPLELVNVPDGGSGSFASSSWNSAFASGSLVVGGRSDLSGGGSVSPGKTEVGIVGSEGLAQWGFFQARNTSSAFGDSDPCTQPYVAEIETPLECGASGNLSSILPLLDNATDAVEPHAIPPNPCLPNENATPGAGLWFDTAFHGGTESGARSETIALCGPLLPNPLNVTLDGVAQFPIVVSMQLDGSPIHATGVTWWSGPGPGAFPTAGYSLPSGWVWNVSAVVPGVLPTVAEPTTTALLSFERSACPT